MLSLFYDPTLTSIHDYWQNHSFDYIDLCQQSGTSVFKYSVEVYQLFIPHGKTPVVIEETPENEKIRMQITADVLEEIEHNLKKTLEKIRKENL